MDGWKTEDRMWSLLDKYSLSEEYGSFVSAGKKYNVLPEFIVCISYADSDLGKALLTRNNIGNVGNNDRGNKVHYKSIEDGIMAIGKVLNNKYLSHKQSIGSLSVGGGGSAPYYATSTENWNANVLNCMNMVHQDGTKFNEGSTFRTKI